VLPPACRHARHPYRRVAPRACALTKRTRSTTRPPSAKSAVSPRSSVSNSPSAYRPTRTNPPCANSPSKFGQETGRQGLSAPPVARQALSPPPAGRQQSHHRFSGQQQPHAGRLAKQGELNVDVLEHDACNKLVDWFEDRWKDRWCIDISNENWPTSSTKAGPANGWCRRITSISRWPTTWRRKRGQAFPNFVSPLSSAIPCSTSRWRRSRSRPTT
jgi:hypothetical protein